MEEFELFYEAADELDAIVQEGIFGKESVELLEMRDKVDNATNAYNGIIEMFRNTQYGINNVIGITFRLVGMYAKALQVSPQEPVDILTAFMKGTVEHPELECLSSYTEFICVHNNYKNLNIELSKKESVAKIDSRRLATALLNSYSKGTELTGKIFGHLLTVEQIISGQSHDLYDNTLLSIYDKIRNFEELADDNCKILTGVINRKVRNADAHLNAYYSTEKCCYIMKRNIGKGKKAKTETFEISAKEMLFEIYPKLLWFIQGFMASCWLLVLSVDSPDMYKDAVKYICRLQN